MMCVGNDDDVRSVVYGDNGVLAGMKKGAILVDHTTASATVAREVFQKAKDKGIGFVDAPVSGGQAGAVNGQLGIMCGGEHGDLRQGEAGARRLRQDVRADRRPGRRPAHQDGEPDLHRRHRAGARRGLAFAKRNNLDLEKVIAVISKGAAQSWQMENRWKPMSELKAEGFGFAIEWMRKDMGICLDQAKQSDARLPVAALVDQFYARLEARGGKRWDSTSALIQLCSRTDALASSGRRPARQLRGLHHRRTAEQQEHNRASAARSSASCSSALSPPRCSTSAAGWSTWLAVACGSA